MVGDAYAIASNYLRRTGAIPDTLTTNDRLLEIIVKMFQRGECNKIRLANKAIGRFEAQIQSRLTVLTTTPTTRNRACHGSRHRPHHADL